MPPTTAEVSTENGKLEDSQILLNSLKYCLRKVTSSSLNVHKEIFAENLPKCLENSAFQDAHLKGFAKILANVVPRYRRAKMFSKIKYTSKFQTFLNDREVLANSIYSNIHVKKLLLIMNGTFRLPLASDIFIFVYIWNFENKVDIRKANYKKSKLVVEKFISKVLKKHGLTFAKVLISEIHPIAVLLAKLNPCISNSSQACMLLRWCNLIYALVSDLPDQVACMLASSEMLAYNAVCAEGSSWYGYRLLAYAEKTLTENKSPAVFIKYLDVMLKNPQVEWLSGVGFIYQYLTNKKSVHLVKPETRKSLLEMFINTCIQTKLSAPIHSLKFIKPMLKYLSHDDFKVVFPLIKKGLLRNPETIMLGAGYFFSGLSIDLSQHIDELLDSIPAHLASKNEAISEPATFTVQQIALQCSQCSAVQKLIEKLIKILAGSEGKLAQPEHRALVLKSLRDASETPGNSLDRETLAGVVFDKLTPLVTVEAHEGTQIEGVNAVKSWSKYFVNSLPKNFFEVFKKIMTAKTQSPVTRPYYIQMATEVLKGNLLIEEGMQIIEVLTQTVEKSIGHQVNTVYEALAAATLLSRIATLDHLPEGKLDSFWNFALNPTKRPLLSEKFLSSATPEQLEQLEKFTSSLFTNHLERVTSDKIKPWYSAFVTLITGGGWKTVKQTKLLIKNVGMHIEGFYEALADEAHNVLLQGGENMEVVAGKLANFYHYLVCVQPTALEKSEFLMKHCFLPIHHPLIEATLGNMFGKVFNSIKVPLKDLANHAQQILNTVFQRNELNESDVNTLRALIKLFPESLLALSMQKINVCTDDPALLQVTGYEIAVLATPAGEVYDQSIYESAKKINTKQTNVKRENKAYSYKEEKADQELKEEMRRKKGEHKKIELSKKQQEQLEAIKVQENEIRQRLGDLKREFSKHITLLQLWIESRSALLKPHFGTLINTCIALLRSGFSAPHILPCFLQLSQVIYDGELHHLGEFIGNTVVRHLQPPCELPLAWQHEQLDAITRRALNTIHAFTHERNSYLMMAYTWKKPFTAPAFAYMLPLLKVVLKNRGAVVKHDEGLRMKALQIIMAHCTLRSADPTDLMDEHGPQLLPRADTLRVLSEAIMACDGHTKDAKIQLYANTVFDELCKASSSKDGAATASIAEVELLLGNVLSQCTLLRNASLKGLLEIVDALVGYYDQIEDTLARRTLIVRFDVDDVNAQLAQKLWEEADLNITGGVTCDLVDDVTHALSDVRQAACEAVKTAVAEQPTLSAVVLQTLLETYKERNKIPPPVIDNLGRVVSAPFVDPWEARHGVGLAIGKIYEHVPEDQLETLFHFFIPMAFGDRNENVRKQMLDSALLYVNHFGQNNINMLLSMFETFLDSAPDSSAHDVIRQSVVILTGSLAKNFQKTDPKIKPIFSKLMTGLATPSQQVQKAVADCLPPLCAAIKEEAPELIKGLLNQLFESESYGERRGAAFGLAGIIKGLGILSLKQHNIISNLNDAIQDKKAWKHREGALFAFETLCTMLGRLFEPYVVHLLPHLLLCFGDGNQYVREAADETAKAVMRNLSNHGVKLVLPSLLKALEEDSWRTKTGSAELLGAMSFCAPKQLSSCLPSIVPRLTEILGDSHLKVQKAGQQALRQIGGVIRNPEILEISEIILDALSDPNRHTVGCLQALLNTSFVHFIDAPSLALIMPTLERALEQRPTETKKMAAQILGNMYALTDPKDLSPYLPAVVPGLKKSLLDPSPEVRGVSARALGAIVKGMGEECFNDLMPWLLETLTSDISSVDRSGAAQGLSEVLHALGQERLDKLMPDVIDTTMKVELPPNIREGYLMLYIYLPTTFGDDFIVYISSIIPAILKGLADESEYVRETSLKAGQRIISMYSDSAIQLLLPQLEAGLFDEHWRIRYSSVQLLGDLLFKLSGVTGKQSTVGDEDDNFGTAHSAQVILETLGEERRNHVFAGLYMGRSDVALHVRQSSLHVWKVIVQNTAKTLREILPTLFELLLGCLASDCYDKRQVAARTLGDLVRKLGERILPEIIPILEDGLNNEEGSKRQGVCIGLSEIMDSCSREMMSTFEDSLVNTVRAALLDPLPEVRYAASLTFENLHNTIGHKALDGVLPHVFEKLEDESLSEFALDGLKQVMAVKSKSVLPFLVPRLTEPPVNTKALSILASVAGEALVKHLDRILPAMIEAIHATNNENNEFEGTQSLLMSVEDETGVRIIIDELTAATKNQKPGLRKVGADLLCVFCKETQADYTVYVQSMFIVALQLMNDVDALVAEAGWLLLDSLVKRLDPSEQLMHLSSLKQAIRFVKPDIRNNQLPGFCILKKGVTPVIPMFREGVLNGPQDVKEQASLILGDVIRLTSPAALRPSVVHITGPLIRILGDRFAFSVKVAILDTLGLLLEKVGVMLKPFFAQLQTTFIKALNDANRNVRKKSAWALGLLSLLHSRLDSLFTELKNGVKNNEDPAIRETTLLALRTIILNGGAKMGDAVKSAMFETLVEFVDASEDSVRVASGAALGALCQVLSNDDLEKLTSSLLDVNPTLDWIVCHGRAVALSYALYHSPSQVLQVCSEHEIVHVAVQHTNNDRVPICISGVHSLGHLLLFSNKQTQSVSPQVVESFRKTLKHSSNDVRNAALSSLKYACRNSETAPYDLARYFVPDFPALFKDRNSAVRASAELTLAYVLQLHKNDLVFDQCVADLPDSGKFLTDYKETVFEKLGDTLATDVDDYVFVT